MKIHLLEPYGYCAGVARAIQIAKDAKGKNSEPIKAKTPIGLLFI